MSVGDARVLFNGLETAAALTKKVIGKKHVEQAMQQIGLKYDKQGEEHFNTISAFIKSMRGSDADASLFYLQRMIQAGEDPKFIARRMVVFASEDIGMAAPYALTLAVATFQTIERIGLPEGEYALTHCAIALAKSPKSRAVANALSTSRQAVMEHPSVKVPLNLRNAPTKLMKELGYNQDYKWQANFKPGKGFMPKGLEDIKFYKDD
jgi:putative ATPase